ncbi:hypothetical protein MANES_15G150301v8, partial [Manihot esculenta]
RVNYSKSKILFLLNVTTQLQQLICDVAVISITTDLRKYLGVQIVHGCTHKHMFAPLFQRLDAALLSWKTFMLSPSGRVTLAKSILNALPNHIMQSFYLPRTVSDLLDKKNCDFIWGDQTGKWRVHAVNWDIITLPIDRRGLGIRSCWEMNIAFLAKLDWHLLHDDNSLRSFILQGKYRVTFWSIDAFSPNNNSSIIWRSLIHSAPLL